MAAVVTIATKVVMKVCKCSYKFPVFFCPILRKFEISQQVLVTPPPHLLQTKLYESLSSGAELFHADCQVDRWSYRQT